MSNENNTADQNRSTWASVTTVANGSTVTGTLTEQYTGRTTASINRAIEFLNESDHEFTDISSEKARTYNFGSKGFVKITHPLYLSVSASGGHRIFTSDGLSHYIPSGWLHLSWTTKDGLPHFVK